jgi:hypothetical protein
VLEKRIDSNLERQQNYFFFDLNPFVLGSTATAFAGLEGKTEDVVSGVVSGVGTGFPIVTLTIFPPWRVMR